MQLRKTLTFVFVLYAMHAYSQHKWALTAAVYPSVSWVKIDKQAPGFVDWGNPTETYKPEWGVGTSLGIQRALGNKFVLFAEARYHRWGGNTLVSASTDFFLDLNIRYFSFNMPIGLQYRFWQKGENSLVISAGVGLDYTYKLSFTPSNYYGSVPTITSNTDIETRYLFARVGFERMLTNKLSLICGFEWDNDWLFNSMRRQDFGGFFQQNVILNYNYTALYIGIKL